MPEPEAKVRDEQGEKDDFGILLGMALGSVRDKESEHCEGVCRTTCRLAKWLRGFPRFDMAASVVNCVG